MFIYVNNVQIKNINMFNKETVHTNNQKYLLQTVYCKYVLEILAVDIPAILQI